MNKTLHNRKLLNIELGRVSSEEYKTLPDSGIAVVLDNIRSAHNVGSAFRTADSFKADKIWL
ncbi:MAG: TrmH family RNA methyltransferase, partial [Bacteroidales bacterium]|nr:TrmH family RNA methyltransferase [Bacteroidales bacterium]